MVLHAMLRIKYCYLTNKQINNQPNKAMITVRVEEGGAEALHGHLGSEHRFLFPANCSSVVRVQVLMGNKGEKISINFVIY